jgi:hypothetical protein
MVATMGRSVRRLPHPIAGAPHGERRRCVRQRLHTPVYASFNGPQTGMVVDLSELLDLHEDGFAVQTSERLEVNRAVSLCLDLPETRNFIHGSGQVMWSDDGGRGGIKFSGLSESSKKILKEWLFANLLIACSNHAARTEQLTSRAEENLPELQTLDQSSAVAPRSDRSEIFSSVDAVRREVSQIDDDFDAVLKLITERALTFSAAGGAALAYLTADRMACRARAGELAPPLGAPIDVNHGMSGECVRGGVLVSCEDTENDSRIDPEIGRALGIRSLMAVPIVSRHRVVGLLEVFSPHPRAFTRAHATVLEQLVEMICKIPREKTRPEETVSETAIRPESLTEAPQFFAPESDFQGFKSADAIREVLGEQNREVPGHEEHPAVPESPSRLLYRALIGLAIVVVTVALGYLIGPVIEKRWADSPQASQREVVNSAQAASEGSGPGADNRSTAKGSFNGQRGQPKSLDDLRKLADHGDPEAQWQIGVRYHDGEDVPQSDAQAVWWFQRAAEQGNVAAQGALGAYYWRGRGVPQDLSKAYFWSAIAMAQGDEISKGRVEGLSSQMTRSQVSTARQQAEEWIHTHTQRAKSESN